MKARAKTPEAQVADQCILALKDVISDLEKIGQGRGTQERFGAAMFLKRVQARRQKPQRPARSLESVNAGPAAVHHVDRARLHAAEAVWLQRLFRKAG